jgi:hypothetical protein
VCRQGASAPQAVKGLENPTPLVRSSIPFGDHKS